jgi:hypothetical protein
MLAPDSFNVPDPTFASPPAPPIEPVRFIAFAWVSIVSVPLSVRVLASVRLLAAARSVVPFANVSEPVPSAVLDPTASVPALSSVPPE